MATNFLIWTIYVIFLSQFHKFILIWDNHSNCKIVMRLAMEEDLVNEGAFCVNVLHFLCCHIFTLLQFENIFLSVYNLHCISSRHQLPNITGFQPSIWCYGLLCFLLIFVISHKNSWSPKPYLSSWTWSSKLIFVFACIMHLLNILKFELKISLN